MIADGHGLVLGVAPASDHAEGLDLQGLIDFLVERTGTPITIKRCRTYGEAMEALQEGKAQLGWLGPAAYIEVAQRVDIEPLAVGLRKDETSPNYQSLFIAPLDGPVRSLEDIRGMRLAISDSHSTSGYQVPRMELAEIGISLEDESTFKVVIHAVNHDEAIRHLLDADADVIAVSSVNFDQHVAEGSIDADRFRIVHRSRQIPSAPLVCLQNLDPNLKERLKRLILEAHHHIDVGGYGGELQRYLDPTEGRRNFLESYLRPQWGWRTFSGIIGLIGATALTMVDLEVNPLEIVRSTSTYLVDVIGRMMPPDFSNLTNLLLSMLETIEMAFLGTMLAIALSIPIGLFSARNVAPNLAVFYLCRTITIFFRAIPEFIMAMILVIAIGFGAMPGVLALGFHTMGFLAKFYAESIEDVDVGPMESIGSMGANRTQVFAFAVVPQVMPSFVANNLYIFDRNIRMATMLGIVGAGGIGYELQSAFRLFEYPRVSAIVLVIFVAIYALDMISSYIRSKI
jgi:phosphonate transport system permease protein